MLDCCYLSNFQYRSILCFITWYLDTRPPSEAYIRCCNQSVSFDI